MQESTPKRVFCPLPHPSSLLDAEATYMYFFVVFLNSKPTQETSRTTSSISKTSMVTLIGIISHFNHIVMAGTVTTGHLR